MKKLICQLFLLLLIVTFSSCRKKTDTPVIPAPTVPYYNIFSYPIAEDMGCMQRVWTGDIHFNPLPTTAKKVAAEQLFRDNNIAFGNLRFFDVSYDTTNFGAFVHVKADQYVNGLAYFSGWTIYHFRNGKFDSFSGKEAATSSLDTIPKLKLTQVKKRFMDCLKGDTFGSNYQDSCSVAQFGYYNINAVNGNSSVQLVKAWMVHPVHAEPIVAYINDEDGKVIYFTNGVMTLQY